ncbi:MAG: hypothetical protein IPL55_07355 [Saprospiraceae bacterium]|nr:hypothetical protein [Saprospiraceae bacterium]
MSSKPSNQPPINYFRHQDQFYEIVKSVDSINFTHIALYQALFRRWNLNFFNNPFHTDRETLMAMSGIKSKSAYYKVLRELESFDLLRYYPSTSMYVKSLFCLSTFEFSDISVSICIWGLSNHQPLRQKRDDQETLFNDIDTNSSQINLPTVAALKNGKGKLVLLKKYKLEMINVQPNVEVDTQQNETSTYDPLTDPKYQSYLDHNISSLSYNSYNANHQNSKSGRTCLRPPGVQVDPNADYSIPL